jgi:hypothetical protein
MRTLAFCLVSLLLVACDREPVAPASRVALRVSRFENAPWSEPANLGAPVNSPAAEMNAALSPDELSLYFVSTRAGGLGGADIWVSRRASLDSPWEAPVNLGSGVNSPGLEAAPSVSIDGHLLFFSSDRPGGQGSNDIYIARRADKHDDLSWGPATDLGPDVNTAGFEAGGVYLQSAEAGSANLYFVRGPNSSNLNIFVAPITAGGETRGPATPVVELNDASPGISSVHPSVRTDGREVFFHSNRTGGFGATDLWVSTRPSVHDPWSTPVNLGVPLNSATGEFQPTLSFDARTLIFTSTRAGGLGNSDIWVATRQPTP